MEHLESVEEARYFVEEASKKLNLEDIGVTLDAEKETINAECQEELEEIHPEYAHLDTDNVDEKAKNNTNIYRQIDIPDIKKLKEKTVN